MSNNEHMGDMQSFGDNVRVEREKNGWSRLELQRRLEKSGATFHATTLRRIETGEQEPRLSEALALASALDVPLVQLIGTTEGVTHRVHAAFDELDRQREGVVAAYKRWRRQVFHAGVEIARMGAVDPDESRWKRATRDLDLASDVEALMDELREIEDEA
ncbi:helix-turn-helix domain-containing protein [Corynebacterium hylobatis]|uniref:helix-turn-helix domain-containing protein n=1 Tax=Corynebacterium hylobatis TaxID=1859290 RepID=UPI0013E069EB|nr:helix-turn-helix transcriptional regulator [Corynebacterium hylobatis]